MEERRVFSWAQKESQAREMSGTDLTIEALDVKIVLRHSLRRSNKQLGNQDSYGESDSDVLYRLD